MGHLLHAVMPQDDILDFEARPRCPCLFCSVHISCAPYSTWSLCLAARFHAVQHRRGRGSGCTVRLGFRCNREGVMHYASPAPITLNSMLLCLRMTRPEALIKPGKVAHVYVRAVLMWRCLVGPDRCS